MKYPQSRLRYTKLPASKTDPRTCVLRPRTRGPSTAQLWTYSWALLCSSSPLTRRSSFFVGNISLSIFASFCCLFSHLLSVRYLPTLLFRCLKLCRLIVMVFFLFCLFAPSMLLVCFASCSLIDSELPFFSQTRCHLDKGILAMHTHATSFKEL